MNLPRRIFQNRFFYPFRVLLDPESERIKSFIQKAASSMAAGTVVIDVGAGQCQYKNFFSDKKYIGVDFGAGDTEWDYSRVNVIADVHFLPIRSDTADAVLCTQVLEHTYNPQKVVSEIARILKEGGTAFFTVPQGWGEHQVPYDYFRYTQYGMKVLLCNAGLNVAEIGKTTGLFGYLANRLTMIPKVLFWNIKNPVWRFFFLPLELLCYLFFVVLLPLLISPLDRFDKDKAYTLNYEIIAKKKHSDLE
jgi:SAM-dependent methyltransferase